MTLPGEVPLETTREQILDAVERLINDRGTRKLTIEAVAAEAGMSKGGVLYNFRSKQELLRGVVLRFVLHVREATFALQGRLESEGNPCPLLHASFAVYKNYRDKEAVKSIFALAVQEPDLMAEFQEMCSEFGKAVVAEVKDPVWGQMFELIVDGLYYRLAVGVESRSHTEIDGVIDRVLDLSSQMSKQPESQAEAGN